MKRILFSIALFSSLISSAQMVIVDEKYEKNNEPVSFTYLPISKKIVVFKGKQLPESSPIYNAYCYNVNANKEVVFENEEFNSPIFAADENAFKAKDISSEGRGNLKYVVSNKDKFRVKISDLNNSNNSYFGIIKVDTRIYNIVSDDRPYFFNRRSFNNLYDLGFTNEKGSENINFEKDEIYLEVYNVKSNAKSRVKIEKPNLSLLMGDMYTDFKGKTSFNCRIKGNDTFDLITKSVSKDKRNTILYKTSYDFSGKKLTEVSYKLDLKDGLFSLSNNYGGGLDVIGSGANHAVRSSLDVLSINNYYEDSSNGDVYIYGVFSSNDVVSPCGYYIFKFDKNGTKIWESISKIKDSYETDDYSDFDVSLVEYNKNLMFYFSSSNRGGFSNYSIVDKGTGSLLKTDKVSYDSDRGFTRYISFINNTFVTKDKSLKKKTFSNACFIAMDLNKSVLEYIKSIPSEGKAVYFESVFSDQGIWLVETDNLNYYKILLFKE